MSYGHNTNYTSAKPSHPITDGGRKAHKAHSIIEDMETAKELDISYEDMNKGGIYEHRR